MKYLITTIIFLSLHIYSQGQSNTIIKEYDTENSSRLYLESDYGDIKVNIWEGKTIKLEASVIVNGNDESDAIDIYTKKSGNRFIIETEMHFDKIPQMISIKDDNGNWTMYTEEDYKKLKKRDHNGLNYGHQSDITITYWIPRSIILEAETTYGDIAITELTSNELKLHSTYGDIDATLINKTQLPSIELSSTYGAVDLTLSKNAKADIEMHTSYGEILTNFDLHIEHMHSNHNNFGEDIESKLNGGGEDLLLEATYGKVYLRNHGD